MRLLPDWFREYLAFHRTERRGIVVLMIGIILLICFNGYQRYFWRSDWEEMALEFGPEIIRFQELMDSTQVVREDRQPWIPAARSYFQFDPNTLDSAGWIRLGFSPKQAASVLNYRKSGARFRNPKDMKKLYVVDEERFTELEPFIRIAPVPVPSSRSPKVVHDRKRTQRHIKPVMIELNTADSSALIALKGIGPSFARRMIKYRNLFGGYHRVEQVLEVYGMDSSRYLPIVSQLLVDTALVSRIDVNVADVRTLMRHPYISRNQAWAIVRYREQHGDFQSTQDLDRIHLLNRETLQRVHPYLTVGDRLSPSPTQAPSD